MDDLRQKTMIISMKLSANGFLHATLNVTAVSPAFDRNIVFIFEKQENNIVASKIVP